MTIGRAAELLYESIVERTDTRPRTILGFSSQTPKMLPQRHTVATAIYVLSILIYLHPLTLAPTPSVAHTNLESPDDSFGWTLIHAPAPQLDELHITSKDHHDVNPPLDGTSWMDAWSNDYWGRPLSFESSHKSWRPVSVWSFRMIKGGRLGGIALGLVGKVLGSISNSSLQVFGLGYEGSPSLFEVLNDPRSTEPASDLFVHRVVNVLIHAAIVQLVGVVAALIFADDASGTKHQGKVHFWTRILSMIIFALHPVHVEAVANIANRPHILALLFNATLLDPGTPLLAFAALSSMALLSAETAIFQFPAIIMTMIAVRYREIRNNVGSCRKEDESEEQKPFIQQAIVSILPRAVLLSMVAAVYLVYRYSSDSLSIPRGLIRPAENPFYAKVDANEWSYGQRLVNYSFILSLHILKSLGVELIGFSHEYGYDCIPEIQALKTVDGVPVLMVDLRLLVPVILASLAIALSVRVWLGTPIGKDSNQAAPETVTEQRLLVLVLFSWIATLFPISGILKVGTFVADRVVVASSFGISIFVGRVLAIFMLGRLDSPRDECADIQWLNGRRLPRPFFVAAFCLYLATRTHNRTADWMDSMALLGSSLKSCPRSIKSNLEMSKLYSGLVPHKLDLDRATSLITTAQSIDPSYCDVHQQFAHVYFQQSKYIEFEEEMVKSLLCPFTMGQAMNNWQQYWKVILQDSRNTEAKLRYQNYMTRIQVEVEESEREGRELA